MIPPTGRNVLLIGGFLAVALAVAFLAPKPPAPPETPRLRAAAVERDGIIVFASDEPDTMTSCAIDLNAMEFFGGGYSYRLGPVEPGGKRLIPATDFLSGSDRFDPQRKAVTSLIIVCDTKNGQRNWGWQKR